MPVERHFQIRMILAGVSSVTHVQSNEVVTKKCTLSSDTKCSKTCNWSGYFFSNPQQVCKRCSYCCLDEKDEEQPQCINQGLKAFNRYCSPRPDRACAPLIISTPTGSVISTEARSPTKHRKIEGVIVMPQGIGSLFQESFSCIAYGGESIKRGDTF